MSSAFETKRGALRLSEVGLLTGNAWQCTSMGFAGVDRVGWPDIEGERLWSATRWSAQFGFSPYA